VSTRSPQSEPSNPISSPRAISISISISLQDSVQLHPSSPWNGSKNNGALCGKDIHSTQVRGRTALKEHSHVLLQYWCHHPEALTASLCRATRPLGRASPIQLSSHIDNCDCACMALLTAEARCHRVHHTHSIEQANATHRRPLPNSQRNRRRPTPSCRKESPDMREHPPVGTHIPFWRCPSCLCNLGSPYLKRRRSNLHRGSSLKL